MQVLQYHSGILHRLLRFHEQFMYVGHSKILLYVRFKNTDLRSAFFCFVLFSLTVSWQGGSTPSNKTKKVLILGIEGRKHHYGSGLERLGK